ncbi:4-amino-4-deoxychorismate lyase [Enemella evansiae]|uniref:aminotransferase class IV n=1 Tax=Enemella evansiae TaxID=2016499 RepID=UPI000B9732CB|nr:aminotransferase class IV [Enemella evansiae]OYN98171.1 4-amino-4-deoxychorismate lyase [Enemella evansiae]
MAEQTDDLRVWVDGELYAEADAATVSATDHGLVVGDGVFEAFKAIDGKAFTPSRHLARLQRSAKAMGLPAPDLVYVTEGMDAVLEGFDHPLGLFRITYTGGRGPLGSGAAYGPPTLVVAVRPAPELPPTTSIVTTPWTRNVEGALAGVKSTSYGENVLGLAYAAEHEATEGIFVNSDGNLCEGTGSNIFCVFEDEVITPPLSAAPLAGITRALTIEWGLEAGFAMVERDLDLTTAKSADEVFLTSSSRDVQGVSRWDQTEWEAPGRYTRQLQELFRTRMAQNLDPQ